MLKSRNSRIKAKLGRILVIVAIISVSYTIIFPVLQEGVFNNEEALHNEKLRLKEVQTPVTASEYVYCVGPIETNATVSTF